MARDEFLLCQLSKVESTPQKPGNRFAYTSPYHSALALEELISDARDYAEETLEAMRVREMLESFEQTEREIVRLLMQGIREIRDPRAAWQAPDK